MKKSKKTSFVVNWEIFPFDVLVCLGLEKKDVILELKKRKYELNKDEKEGLTMYGIGRTCILDGNMTVLWLKYYPNLGDGVLAHEIFHAVEFLLKRVGVSLSDDSNNEVVAYMIQYLNNKIYSKLTGKKIY